MKSHSFLIGLILFCSCAPTPVRRELRRTHEISYLSPSYKYIKCHMKDGTVYVLYEWHANQKENSVTGLGAYMDINRKVIEERGNLKSRPLTKVAPFSINLEDVSLIETNETGSSLLPGIIVDLAFIGGVTIACLANPKACFGSCPTFYTYNGDTLTLQAEGFSASICPALEDYDIDMLYSAQAKKDFELLVTNEALETHFIKQANLLVVPKQEDERIFLDPDGFFYKTTAVRSPLACSATGRDILSIISKTDEIEYFSTSSESDLKDKEEIVLEFNKDDHEKVGLLIGKRQTLLTTYLLYQGLAYMGLSTSYWLSNMDFLKKDNPNNIIDLLGGIEVYSKNSLGEWIFQGTCQETGPIATDFNIIPIEDTKGNRIELKLRMTKGLWRIDYLALSKINGKVTPTIILPSQIETISGQEIDPYSKLIDENQYLVTFPGDKYKIKYELPSTDLEIFIDSKGYYLEWIRREWISEQNFRKLNMMVNKPDKFLKIMAKEFKEKESTMEKSFWNSRYEKN